MIIIKENYKQNNKNFKLIFDIIIVKPKFVKKNSLELEVLRFKKI
jgi:hypothetical protein